MAPQKKEETIDSISLGSKVSFDIQDPFGLKERSNEKRKNTFHYVVHTIAFMCIIPFLFMVFLGTKIPPEYSTIISVIIGFYFGRSLFT